MTEKIHCPNFEQYIKVLNEYNRIKEKAAFKYYNGYLNKCYWLMKPFEQTKKYFNKSKRHILLISCIYKHPEIKTKHLLRGIDPANMSKRWGGYKDGYAAEITEISYTINPAKIEAEKELEIILRSLDKNVYPSFIHYLESEIKKQCEHAHLCNSLAKKNYESKWLNEITLHRSVKEIAELIKGYADANQLTFNIAGKISCENNTSSHTINSVKVSPRKIAFQHHFLIESGEVLYCNGIGISKWGKDIKKDKGIDDVKLKKELASLRHPKTGEEYRQKGTKPNIKDLEFVVSVLKDSPKALKLAEETLRLALNNLR
jgi:hypothetical protein